jgi:hypothetical protein
MVEWFINVTFLAERHMTELRGEFVTDIISSLILSDQRLLCVRGGGTEV